MPDSGHRLDDEALALFAQRGFESGPTTPQSGEANSVKVRRVMQLIEDLAPKPFARLRILDLGCHDGNYAIEAALRGAAVVAIDARDEVMSKGAAVAERHAITNVEFKLEDARRISRESHGRFDVVLCLGLLYHLDVPDLFPFIKTLGELCDGLLVIDTLVSQMPNTEVEFEGETYQGERRREHGDNDSPEEKRARLLRSIDGTHAFLLAKPALSRALTAAGFSSVLEAHAPPEPGKQTDRVTLAAIPGRPVTIASFPWINELCEDEIARRVDPAG